MFSDVYVKLFLYLELLSFDFSLHLSPGLFLCLAGRFKPFVRPVHFRLF